MPGYHDILNDPAIGVYIRKSDAVLGVMGFTEHGHVHCALAAARAASILEALGYPERDIELARIAGYLHDIGNSVNRNLHALTGGCLAFTVLERLGFPPEDTAGIVGAVGHHDEATGRPVSAISAALILADKSDVRRSRVREGNPRENDIHDRVNHAVLEAALGTDPVAKTVRLSLKVDTAIAPIIEYFEIFTARMAMCRCAANYLGLRFQLVINEVELL
jgi:hypothetical protein